MRWATLVLVFALAACGSGKDAIADRVEERADARAEALEDAGNSMENAMQRDVTGQQANTMREAGEERATAIRESDLEADQLDSEQQNKLVNAQVRERID